MAIVRYYDAHVRLRFISTDYCELYVTFTPEGREHLELLGKDWVLAKIQLISPSILRFGDDSRDLEIYGFRCETDVTITDLWFIADYIYQISGLGVDISLRYPEPVILPKVVKYLLAA